MEKKHYKIKIEGNVNDYVQGRISGIIAALANDDLGYPHKLTCDVSRWPWRKGKIESIEMSMDATVDEYCKIKATIEKYYPGLCTYYIKNG